MSFVVALWLPIFGSAVLSFVVSAASHMALPWRRNEWGRITSPEQLQAALRGMSPGQYMFPASSSPRDQMKKEWLDRWASGPSGWITIAPPGPVNMRRNMALSVVAYLAVSLLIAYVSWAALGPAPRAATIFRVVTTIALLAYGVGTVYHSIWYHRPWRVWISDAADALVLAAVTGAVFVRLWPS